MMTLLFIIFLVLSFPFSGMAAVAKASQYASKGVHAGANAVDMSTTAALGALRPISTVTHQKERFSFGLLNRVRRKRARLRNKLARTNHLRIAKRTSLRAKLAATKVQMGTRRVINIKDKAVHAGAKTAEISTDVVNKSAKATKVAAKAAEMAALAAELAAKGIAAIFRTLSTVCEALIPIDWIITLIVLVLAAIVAIVCIFFFPDAANTDPTTSQYTSNTPLTSNDPNAPVTEDTEELYSRNKIDDTGYYCIYQQDPLWANEDWDGDATIGSSSCGFTAMAMLVSKETDKFVSPKDIVDKFKEANIPCRTDSCTHSYCSYTSYKCPVCQILEFYGLSDKFECTLSKNTGDTALADYDTVLAAGGYIVLDTTKNEYVDNTLIWPYKGHFVLIVSGNKTDGYRLHDPSMEKNNRVQSYWPYNSHTFKGSEIDQGSYYFRITRK